MSSIDWYEEQYITGDGMVVSITGSYVGLIGDTYKLMGEPDYIRVGIDKQRELLVVEPVPQDMKGARPVRTPDDDQNFYTTRGVYSKELINRLLRDTALNEDDLTVRIRVGKDTENGNRYVGSVSVPDS